MYSDVSLQPGVLQYLNTLEADSGLPIAIVDGGGGQIYARANTYVPELEMWPEEQRANLTVEDMDAGVLLVSYARPPGDGAYMNHRSSGRYPVSFFPEGLARRIPIYGNYFDESDGYEVPDGWERVLFERGRTSTEQRNLSVFLNQDERLVLFPFGLRGVRNEMDLAAIFEPVRRLCEGDSDEALRRATERAKERFSERLRARQRVHIERAEARHAEAENTLRDFNVRLAQATRGLIQAQEDLRVAQIAAAEQVRISPEDEFAAIERHDLVERVMVRGASLIVETTALRMTNPETRASVPLGRLQFRIPLAENQTTLRVVGVEPPPGAENWLFADGYCHPHVRHEACWGDQASALYEALARAEFGHLVELLLQYVQTFNPRDSWGNLAERWFNLARNQGTLEEPDEPQAEAGDDPTAALRQAARALGITQADQPQGEPTPRIPTTPEFTVHFVQEGEEAPEENPF